MLSTSAQARWTELDSDRSSFIRRCEKYASFTIPKVCLPQGYNQNQNELQHDYQSLGAQAVNHLSNKLMLALFAPSRPFFRLDPGPKMLAQLAQLELSDDELSAILAVAEKNAVKILDQRAIRPKLYEAIKHIIVTGNAMLILGKKPKVLGLKNYVVKRDPEGKVLETITKESVAQSALDPAVLQLLLASNQIVDAPHATVNLYKWVVWEKGSYRLTQWVNEVKLPSKFNGKYTEDTMPYRAITWDLASGDDYGTGLVEDFSGDFASLSIMSEATIQSAILASEFRWLVNPAGQTKPEDLQNSRNGDALPGTKGDIELLQSGSNSNLAVNLQIGEQYINRIGAGFLLQSAVTRNAERVTAEEIRQTAEELETGLGGAYSRIAVDVQAPLATWLMNESGQKIAGSDIKPTIVTGLDAMSRTGDRDNLMLFLQDVAGIGQLPETVQVRLKLTPIIAAFAAARGLGTGTYLLTEDEAQQVIQQQQQQAMQMEMLKRGVDPNQPQGQPTQ